MDVSNQVFGGIKSVENGGKTKTKTNEKEPYSFESFIVIIIIMEPTDPIYQFIIFQIFQSLRATQSIFQPYIAIGIMIVKSTHKHLKFQTSCLSNPLVLCFNSPQQSHLVCQLLTNICLVYFNIKYCIMLQLGSQNNGQRRAQSNLVVCDRIRPQIAATTSKSHF